MKSRGWIIFVCSVHCRRVHSLRGLVPLAASPSCQVWPFPEPLLGKPKMSPDIGQYPLGGQNHSPSPLRTAIMYTRALLKYSTSLNSFLLFLFVGFKWMTFTQLISEVHQDLTVIRFIKLVHSSWKMYKTTVFPSRAQPLCKELRINIQTCNFNCSFI